MLWLQFIFFLGSIIVLYFGAEWALEGSEKIGKHFGLSPLVIGLLLIGLGTSLPELFVTHLAVHNQKPLMGVGNILGSNIANSCLILAISSIITPLSLSSREIFFQTKFHLALTIMVVIFLFKGQINQWACAILFAFFIFFVFFTFKDMKRHMSSDENSDDQVYKLSHKEMSIQLLKFGCGLIFLFFGGEYLLKSGSEICKHLGISEYVISAVLLALGTSFPELVTCVLACIRKKSHDVIVGNIIGSNIFNVALVLGSLGVYKIDGERNYLPELIVLSFIGVFIYAMSRNKISLGRKSGSLLITVYAIILYIWL